MSSSDKFQDKGGNENEKKLGKKGTDDWTGSFYALWFGRTAECISR